MTKPVHTKQLPEPMQNSRRLWMMTVICVVLAAAAAAAMAPMQIKETPVIQGIRPDSGEAGDIVTIVGFNFVPTDANLALPTVRFGVVPAETEAAKKFWAVRPAAFAISVLPAELPSARVRA